MWASSRSITTGVGFSPRSFSRAAIVPLSDAGSVRNAVMSGSARSGAGVRSSRWKVPPEATARSAVIAETMLPAAPVTSTTESDVSGIPASVSRGARRSAGRERLLEQGDAEATTVDPADLDASGVAQGLLDEQVGDGGGPAVDRQVDRLDQGIGALLLVGLGEAGHRAAEGAMPRRRPSSRGSPRAGSPTRGTHRRPTAGASSA